MGVGFVILGHYLGSGWYGAFVIKHAKIIVN